MNPTSHHASHALALFVLLGLGVLVFHRSGLKHQFSRNAAGSAGTSAQPTAARERSFRAEGIARVDAIWPTGPDGVELRPSETSDSDATVEPLARVLLIKGNDTELGAIRGILQEMRKLPDCRIANVTLHDQGGSSLRMEVTLKAEPTGGGSSGTYRITGGTGTFAGASGIGSYRDAPLPKQWERSSIALEGTIYY